MQAGLRKRACFFMLKNYKFQFVVLLQMATNPVILSVVEQIRKNLWNEVEGSVPKNAKGERILRLRFAPLRMTRFMICPINCNLPLLRICGQPAAQAAGC